MTQFSKINQKHSNYSQEKKLFVLPKKQKCFFNFKSFAELSRQPNRIKRWKF